MKAISIIGSTGSVGVTTLDVVSRFPDRFRVVALAAGRNLELLADQIRRFRPELVSVETPELARDLTQRLRPHEVTILHGGEGVVAVATHPEAKLVMSALVGALGLAPTLAAIKAGKDIAFANKEVLVVAGEVVTRAVREYGVRLLPVDSEHNAVFQCIEGRSPETVKRIILTASGGPFRELPADRFGEISIKDALNHPTWRMGNKITIDSATLMNKGLEVIEAHWLFNVPGSRIEVLIHPQSVIHSLVSYADGSVLAQLGNPDMRTPIAHALAFPERVDSGVAPLDLAQVASLTFEKPDLKRFPCLALALQALEAGGTASAALNAANEIAVEAFLARRIGFMAIGDVVSRVLDTLPNGRAATLEEVLAADAHARRLASEFTGALASGAPQAERVTH